MMRKPVERLAQKLINGGACLGHEVGDLVNVALAAIWRARDKFDERLSSFATYGMIKARSAMLDEIRHMDHVPRLERAKAKKDGRFVRRMESIEHDFTVILRRDERTVSPLQAASASDLWRRVAAIVGRRDAEVLEQYYRHGLTLKEIGQQLGLSESRVCQLHALALQRIRRKGIA